MKRKFTILTAALALLACLAIPLGMWGQQTSTLTFTAACGGSGTADDGAEWTVTSDGTESNFDNTRGIHYGTNSAQVQYIQLSTSDISGTITKVVVNASTASGVTATVGVTVGGSTFGGNPQSLSTSATNYTFEGSASGEIVVLITKPEKATKALYCKSIAVTYTTGGTPTYYTVTFNAGDGTFVGNTDFPSTTNQKEAGTYALPSATRSGFTFNGWTTTGNNTPQTGSYTVSGNVDFTASYTENGGGSGNITATLTQSNLELTGSYTTDTEKTIDGVTYVYSRLMKSNDNIQAEANNGTIKNTTPYPGIITSVAITHYGTARATTINGSANGTDWTEVATGSGSITADFSGLGYRYFQITRGSNAAYWTKIEITYALIPTISASAGSDLAYDATEGSIVYEIQNYEEGTMVASTEASWITNFTYEPEDEMGEVSFTVATNTGGPRQATVTLTYTYGDNQTATTDVVVKQKGVPAITVTPATVEVNSALSENHLAIGLESLTIGQASDLGVQFYDEDNQELNGTNAPNWINASVEAVEGSTGYRVHYIVDENAGAARTAYFKVFTMVDEEFIYSDLVTFTQTAAHTLTVLPYVDLGLFTFAGDDSGSPFGDNVWTGTVQVPTGTSLFISIEANEGYVLESLLVNGVDVKDQIVESVYIFEDGMPDYDVVISATAVPQYISTGGGYQLFMGDLVEGDYVIYYDGYAMKNVGDGGGRLSYEIVTPVNDVINTEDAAIIWHIASSGNYWTIYSAEANAYAASTGAKNKAQMLADGTDDKALWTASGTGTGTYEFVNKANTAASVNANLRNNGTYGFACYATSTGGALSLYKKVEDVTIPSKTLNHAQWYFIASPVGAAPANLEDVTDLYYYDEQDHFWRNKHNHTEGFDFGFGKGYLAAYYVEENPAENIVLNFEGGSILAANTKDVLLDYHTKTSNNQDNSLAGWNLVGNPFHCAATINLPCYTISENAINTTANPADETEIGPCEGVLVKADAASQIVTFTKVSQDAPAPQPNHLQMTVAQQVVTRSGVNNLVNDNAIINFNEGSLLEKFTFNADAAKLYIPQNGKEYAIVNAESQGEQPVNFLANVDGQYTLTVNPKGIEMGYLHLIDNMTGKDIDLLQTPSYTFNATTRDYESRFRLVFAANNEDGVSTGSGTFAFYSNGNWIINNAGEATLQVVDLTGRILSSETVNGSVSKTINAVPGVYMLRLINGENVNVQKIVVR